jgi:hypothetical protein
MNPEKREDWDQMLTAPLSGARPAQATEQQVEQEGSDFMAALAMHQGLTHG